MQFPNPIIRSLILYDNNGNAVIVLGPGPSIVVKGTSGSGDIEITQSGGQAIVRFWNLGHTDFAEVFATDVATVPQLRLLSGARASIVDPGDPTVRTSILLDNDGVHMGPVNAGGASIGGLFETFDTGAEARFLDSNGTTIVGWIIQPDFTFFHHGFVIFDGPHNTSATWSGDTNTFTQQGNSAADGKWTTLPLNNGWAAKAGYRVPSYRRDLNNNVQFRGTMTGGVIADNTQVATIAAALVPPASIVMRPAVAPTGAGSVGSSRLFSNGGTGLFCYGMAGVTDIALDGLSYNLDL